MRTVSDGLNAIGYQSAVQPAPRRRAKRGRGTGAAASPEPLLPLARPRLRRRAGWRGASGADSASACRTRVGAALAEVARLADAGQIQSTMTEHFGTINAANLKKAHAFVEGGAARGKGVLEGFGA